MKRAAVAFTLAVVIAVLTSCGGFHAGLRQSHEGLKAMSQAAEPQIDKLCLGRARRCHPKKDYKCKPLADCRTIKKRYAFGAAALHRALGELNAVYLTLKKLEVIK